MLKIEKTVFISYRKTNIEFALAIHQNLTKRGYDVFFDYDGIKAENFEQIILRSIESRANFVFIVTPSALEHCTKPDDWLRREIEHALKYKRNIIPLTFGSIDFQVMKDYMPAYIADHMSRDNGVHVFTNNFNEGMNQLTERFSISLEAVLYLPPPAVKTEEDRQQRMIVEQLTVTEQQLSAEESFEGGVHHLKSDNSRAALAAFHIAIHFNPNFAIAYNYRASIYSRKGKYHYAIPDYTRSIELKNPELYISYNNRGFLYHRMGDFDYALADYNEAIRLKPDPHSFNNRGWLYYKKGDYNRAISDFTEAIRLKPEFAYAYNHRGLAHANKGNFDQAIADYTEAIRLELEYGMANVYNSRGNAYVDKDNYDRAIADYDEAIRLHPKYADAYNNRGVAYSKKGDYDRAIADYTRCIELNNPDVLLSYYNRGRAYLIKGNYDHAIEDFDQALAIDPNYQLAQQMREKALRKKRGWRAWFS